MMVGLLDASPRTPQALGGSCRKAGNVIRDPLVRRDLCLCVLGGGSGALSQSLDSCLPSALASSWCCHAPDIDVCTIP